MAPIMGVYGRITYSIEKKNRAEAKFSCQFLIPLLLHLDSSFPYLSGGQHPSSAHQKISLKWAKGSRYLESIVSFLGSSWFKIADQFSDHLAGRFL